MKRSLVIVFLLVMVVFAGAQDKHPTTYVCTKGKIQFFSKSPLEDIEAVSNSAVCVINTQNKKVSAKVPMSTFDFEKKLMQEHFNENYVESDKYPNAVLDMTIQENLDYTKDGIYDITLKGTFEVHGV